MSKKLVLIGWWSILVCGLFFAGGLAHAEGGQDLIVGSGGVGPYSLTWRGIAPGSETVQVDQQALMRGLDYTLDSEAGTITFTRPLSSSSAASVRYDFDPAHAVRTHSVTKIPLSFDLARTNNGHVSFDANAAPGALTLGLGSHWQSSKAGLTTHLLFAPSTAKAGADHQTSESSRLGFAVGTSANAARGLQLNFGYAHAGANLDTSGDSTLMAGMQTLSLGTKFSPSHQVQGSLDYVHSDPVTGDTGSGNTRTAVALALTPSDTLHLQSHWTQTSSNAGTPTQNADLSVSATPSAKAKLDAGFTATDVAGDKNDTQAISLAAALTPTSAVAVSASVGQTRDSGGAVNRQQVGLTLTPRAVMQLRTGLTLRQTDSTQAMVASVGGQLQPVSFLQFSAAYKSRTACPSDTLDTDTLDTGTASVALSPVRGLRMVGSYAQNPDNGGDTPQRLAQRGLGLETNVGALALTGGYDWQRQYTAPTVGTALHVGLGLRLSGATQIDGSYRQTLTGVGDNSAGTNLYSVGLSHNLGDRFRLSLGGTMQKPVGPAVTAATDYTANASLGMKF